MQRSHDIHIKIKDEFEPKFSLDCGPTLYTIIPFKFDVILI